VAVSSDATVGDALAGYFRAAGLGPDGGYGARWVRLQAGWLPIVFPNIPARVRAVRYHDLHHLVTGYPTTWRGECAIGAWEIASGCAWWWVAWVLNLGAMAIGVVLCPRVTFAAWCRGRRTRNLYRQEYEPLLAQPLAAVRTQLGLDERPPAPRTADRVTFALWTAAGVGLFVATGAIGATLVWLGWRVAAG
jgi:hypothetical protein